MPDQQRLIAKIAAIMKEINVVFKDKEISTTKGSYRITSYESVLAVVRPHLVEKGIIIVRTKATPTLVGSVCLIETEYDIIDSETGETIHAASAGSGQDSSDKHSGKAMTYALKYLLRDLFLLRGTDEDDPDNRSSEQNVQDQIKRQASVASVLDQIKRGVNEGKLTAELANQLSGFVNQSNGDPAQLQQARNYLIDNFGIS